jgi:hypothetical protein
LAIFLPLHVKSDLNFGFPQVQGVSHGKSSGVPEVADVWGLATRSLDPCKMNQTD